MSQSKRSACQKRRSENLLKALPCQIAMKVQYVWRAEAVAQQVQPVQGQCRSYVMLKQVVAHM